MEEENEIDLFEHPELLPQEIRDILQKHQDTWEEKDEYLACADLVADLEEAGYTCDYYLDAEVFNLRPITPTDETKN